MVDIANWLIDTEYKSHRYAITGISLLLVARHFKCTLYSY